MARTGQWNRIGVDVTFWATVWDPLATKLIEATMSTAHRPLMTAATVFAMLLGYLMASLALSGPAAAAGTLTVTIQGRGDVSNDVITCNENVDPCSQAYTDIRVCEPAV